MAPAFTRIGSSSPTTRATAAAEGAELEELEPGALLPGGDELEAELEAAAGDREDRRRVPAVDQVETGRPRVPAVVVCRSAPPAGSCAAARTPPAAPRPCDPPCRCISSSGTAASCRRSGCAHTGATPVPASGTSASAPRPPVARNRGCRRCRWPCPPPPARKSGSPRSSRAGRGRSWRSAAPTPRAGRPGNSSSSLRSSFSSTSIRKGRSRVRLLPRRVGERESPKFLTVSRGLSLLPVNNRIRFIRTLSAKSILRTPPRAVASFAAAREGIAALVRFGGPGGSRMVVEQQPEGWGSLPDQGGDVPSRVELPGPDGPLLHADARLLPAALGADLPPVHLQELHAGAGTFRGRWQVLAAEAVDRHRLGGFGQEAERKNQHPPVSMRNRHQ